MSNAIIHFCAISKITLQLEGGIPKPHIKHVDLRLEVSGNLDRSSYIDGKGLPRREALNPITISLVHGLISNIRMGADKGWWSASDHMTYVIEEMHKAFVFPNGKLTEGTMEY